MFKLNQDAPKRIADGIVGKDDGNGYIRILMQTEQGHVRFIDLPITTVDDILNRDAREIDDFLKHFIDYLEQLYESSVHG